MSSWKQLHQELDVHEAAGAALQVAGVPGLEPLPHRPHLVDHFGPGRLFERRPAGRRLDRGPNAGSPTTARARVSACRSQNWAAAAVVVAAELGQRQHQAAGLAGRPQPHVHGYSRPIGPCWLAARMIRRASSVKKSASVGSAREPLVGVRPSPS